MSIRLKIILIVLPLMIVTLILAGTSSYFVATTGITRVAKEFLGFKADELKKYAESQWNLLVENGFTERPEMVQAAQVGVETFARSMVRSPTELIVGFDRSAQVVMKTGDVSLNDDEARFISELYAKGSTDFINLSLSGVDRVGKGFSFEPFGWYILVTEEKSTFYSDVDKITQQTGIILAVSSILAVILLLIFVRYITRPLVRVVAAMKDIISSNDLSKRVSVDYNDEIGQLSHTFNIMTAELEKAYNQIKRYAFEAVIAQKKEERIRHIFQKYVPQDLIDKFFENPESMLVGDNRVLSVLFSDIRGFTTISESMMPDDLVNSLNRYFSVMVDVIMKHNGIIDKYIGDAIMAFFGAPVKHDDDALQSVLAGLDMIEVLDDFNANQREIGKPEFNIGIGINYGVVTVGNIGCEKKMDYTVIGDMVNLASRLEGLTKVYHQKLIISESVHMKVKDTLPCRLLDSVAVKGKTRGVKIFTTQKSLSETEKRAWDIHNQAMELYYQREFQKAAQGFEEVASLLPGDFISGLLRDRCLEYEKDPPPENWDGVEVMKTK